MAIDIRRVRTQFPSLARQVRGRPAVYFDGPGGTQVPQSVVDAISIYLLRHNANHGGCFVTSQESDRILDEARLAMADLFGAPDPECIVFGSNMTSLTFQMSRSFARTWSAGDEIVVTDSEHDANFTPWLLAACEAGAQVRRVRVRPEDGTLDLSDVEAKLSPQTRFVAVGAASNATGTVHPVSEIARMAHSFGAAVFVDAVHYAPHELIDVALWDADLVVCSAYKFFGPHVGILWGRREWLESLPAYKVRPAPDGVPYRWMTGTQNHEGIAGVLAAVEYLSHVDSPSLAAAAPSTRRERLVRSMNEIAKYERGLCERLLSGLRDRPDYKVWGIVDPSRMHERVPTVSVTSARERPLELATRLAEQGIFVWSGNVYAQPLTEAFGLEPDGLLRIGLVHYNTPEEIDRLLDLL